MNALCSRPALLAPMAAAAIGAAGCSPGDPTPGECRAALLPGDIVISEVMANPIGQRDGKQWIEIYNATSEAIDLQGTHLVSGGERHEMDSFVIEPGRFAVLAGVLREFMDDYHNYAYGDDIGALPSSGGELSIECGSEVIDAATFPGMNSGVSMGLDGAISPDHIANSDPANWCAATSEYDSGGSRGTPGAHNDACGAVLQDTCNDEGDEREVIPLEPGDVVITEVMGKPAAGVDTDAGDWFEVYVARNVDLNGLQLGQYRHDDHDNAGPQPVAQTISSRDCLYYETGSHVVFAGSDDPEENGGLPVVDFVIDFGRSNLPTQSGGVFVGYQNKIFDFATWSKDPWRGCDRRTTPPDCGASLNRDPRHLTPDDSSDDSYWCLSGDRFSDYGRGTPGLSNASCYSGGPCVDETGATRDAVPPEPGDLVVTEVMPAAQEGLDDSKSDWFEVLALADVDFNALQIGRISSEGEYADQRQTLASRRCLRHEAGNYALFVGSDDPELNGGLDADYVHAVDQFVITSSGSIYLTLDDNVDEIVEAPSWPSPRRGGGVALSLDPAQASPEGSSDPGNWCDADTIAPEPYFSCLLSEVVYEDEEGNIHSYLECADDGTDGEAFSFGTPGAENPSCPG